MGPFRISETVNKIRKQIPPPGIEPGTFGFQGARTTARNPGADLSGWKILKNYIYIYIYYIYMIYMRERERERK